MGTAIHRRSGKARRREGLFRIRESEQAVLGTQRRNARRQASIGEDDYPMRRATGEFSSFKCRKARHSAGKPAPVEFEPCRLFYFWIRAYWSLERPAWLRF